MNNCREFREGDPWENLANAIILQAVKDYRSARRQLWKNGSSRAKHEMQKIEDFFHGRWYGQLTQLDPDYLMRKLREEALDEQTDDSTAVS